LLDRFVAAFEAKDIAAMVAIFTKDSVWEMPPFVGWYSGPEDIARLIDTQCPAQGPGDMRLVPTRPSIRSIRGAFARYTTARPDRGRVLHGRAHGMSGRGLTSPGGPAPGGRGRCPGRR